MMPLIARSIDKMPKKSPFNCLAGFLAAWVVGVCVAGLSPHAHAAGKSAPQHFAASRHTKAKPDVSGRHQRVGKASVFARKFAGKKMADGTKMNPHSDNAASKTLPLGTTAKVTNLQTGQSAKVTIRDRGPYVKDRIVDISPATAHKIGIAQHKGVAQVKVDPIATPINGSVKSGIAAQKAKANKPISGEQSKKKPL
jgi:rare lipoprotein A